MSYCDLHKIDRSDLLDVLEIYPDFAESFEKKFQVTFDLRECEMFEAKPIKKKGTRALMKLATLNRLSSINTTGNESLGGQNQPDSSTLHDLNASKASLNRVTETSITNPSPDSTANLNNLGASMSTSNALNVSMGESHKFNQSIDSNAIDAPRKFSTLLRKKSKLIRNAVRLNPILSNVDKRPAKHQTSNISEVEAELDLLLS